MQSYLFMTASELVHEMLYFYVFLVNVLCCFTLPKDEGWNYINVHCRNNDNQPVDWWYLFKPPGVAAPYDDSGRNFSFIDSNTYEGRWQKPNRHITTNNMLQYTLAPLYRGTYVDRVAFIVYDDADADDGSPGAKGRGILLADEVGGIFISHTIPNLADPIIDRPTFPEAELQNGQLIVCISMSIPLLNQLAVRVRYARPTIVSLQIPNSMSTVVPSWKYVKMGPTSNEIMAWTNAPLYLDTKGGLLQGVLTVRKPGQDFCLYNAFAKWKSVILDVYSPNDKPKKNFCSHGSGTRSIDAISLKIPDENVHYINNHTDRSRFAVSTAAHWQRLGRRRTQFWTCTSSLDKEDDSRKGGLLLCIHNNQIWTTFDNFKIKEPECGK